MSELDYWKQQIKKGRIGRREFLGRSAALGVTTALATSMLTTMGIAAEPKKGGSLKIGVGAGATTDSLDPATYPDNCTGLLGGSTGINVAGAIRLAKQLGPGKTIVTILCDSGSRYQSKLYNPEFLRAKDLPTPPWLTPR